MSKMYTWSLDGKLVTDLSFLPVTPVSEGSDNEARCVAQVLIPILDIRSDHSHNDVLLPVITQLRQPSEIKGTGDIILRHVSHHITSWTEPFMAQCFLAFYCITQKIFTD